MVYCRDLTHHHRHFILFKRTIYPFQKDNSSFSKGQNQFFVIIFFTVADINVGPSLRDQARQTTSSCMVVTQQKHFEVFGHVVPPPEEGMQISIFI